MSDCGHHHHHHASGDAKRLIAAFVVIATFMVVEAVGGFISGSLALLADATHMMTDALALALAASAQWFAGRPADGRLHFGYRRIQVLAAFVNGIALAFLIAWIVFEAVKRFFFAPRDVDWSLMLSIAVIGLIANGVAFVILHRSPNENVNIRGAMLHVVSDLLGSVAAIIAAIVIATTGWVRIDPILSIIVAILIGRSAWKLIVETGHILMEGAPNNINPEKFVAGLRKAAPDVIDVHRLRIWQLTPEESYLTMHARIDPTSSAQAALAAVKKYLEDEHGIVQSTIQIEDSDACPDHRWSEADFLQEAACTKPSARKPATGEPAAGPAADSGYSGETSPQHGPRLASAHD